LIRAKSSACSKYVGVFNESKDPEDRPPDALKAQIEQKELGVKTGKGFYAYPNPEYDRSDFLKG
jgi:3-hydroxyacyl-CoA dehydrogenase